MNHLIASVERALKSGLPDRDDLAFLALTGKIESAVRDAVALRLGKDLADSDPSLLVCREYKRCDLAILNSKGSAQLSIEFKDCISGDLSESHKKTPIDDVETDIKRDKCKSKNPLAVLTTKSVFGKFDVDRGIKYLGGKRGFKEFCSHEVEDQAERCQRFVHSRLNVLSAGFVTGTSRSLKVRIDWWLIDGPAHLRQ